MTGTVLSGFFLLGMLLAFLGAVMPSWGYHLSSDYLEVGNYYLSLVGGILLSAPVGQRFLSTRRVRLPLVLTAVLAAGSLFYLGAVGPPWPASWRMAGLGACGFSAGILHSGLFTAISPLYRRDPAATVNLSGLLFGLGALTTALFVATTFYVYKTSAILFFLGVIPALLAGQFSRMQLPEGDDWPLTREIDADLQSPAVYLFSFLLFFQFGNEWAIAGWLPLFLVQRLGISPSRSLMLLALFWFALILGRFVVLAILPKVSHGRLLLASVTAAMLGCIILTFTNNMFGASVALAFTGCGFAAIYPIVVEKIGSRFRSYHPGHFNGLFSFAVTGGLLASASLGYFAHWLGIQVIMGLPFLGSIAVFVLVILIWLETKLHEPDNFPPSSNMLQ